MVDILFVNKSNLGYSTDLQPQIRRKIQGYMINITAANMDMLKKLSRTMRLLKSAIAVLDLDCKRGIGCLIDKDKIKCQSEIERYTRIHNRNETGGFSDTSKMKNDEKVYKALLLFKNMEIDVQTLNSKLSSYCYLRQFSEKSTEQTEAYESVFSNILKKFQIQVSKDLARYDALTKNKLFLLSAPAYMRACLIAPDELGELT